ncbi:MAG: dephospho-CoA kinase [Phycisphaerales bacterium]
MVHGRAARRAPRAGAGRGRSCPRLRPREQPLNPPPPSFPIIGLAGGIGAGKSEVARALAQEGCCVVDSDALGRAALARPQVVKQLVEWWGPSILDHAGAVDRARVAAIVFRAPVERARLEALLHPIIMADRERTFAAAAASGAPAGVIDAPLLFEVGLDALCHAVIFVDAPRPIRLARVKATRNWDEDELARREASQIPAEEKRKRAAYCLMNHGDRADLAKKVRSTLATILAAPSAPGGLG